MNSLSNMRWTSYQFGPSVDRKSAQWVKLHALLRAIERESRAIERSRIGLTSSPPGSTPIDYETLRRERRLSRRVSNIKWACAGGCVAWVALLILM